GVVERRSAQRTDLRHALDTEPAIPGLPFGLVHHGPSRKVGGTIGNPLLLDKLWACHGDHRKRERPLAVQASIAAEAMAERPVEARAREVDRRVRRRDM